MEAPLSGVQCTSCGHRTEPGDAFCDQCGRRVGDRAAPEEPSTGERAIPVVDDGRVRWMPFVAALVVLALIVVAVAIVLKRTAPEAEALPEEARQEGDLTAVGVTAVTPCTAPASQDDAGSPVDFVSSNLLDGDPATAWRCQGDLSGSSIVVLFDEPVELTSLGLVNGYAKRDPTTGTDRYPQGRRVLAATWFVGDQEIPVALADDVQSSQDVSAPPVVVQEVRLRIDETSPPGIAGYDFTVLSDLHLLGVTANEGASS